MGRWGDGEMGRWGDGEMGRWGDGLAPEPSSHFSLLTSHFWLLTSEFSGNLGQSFLRMSFVFSDGG
jgi:hypothetical protein